MKAERRHELHENIVSHELALLVDFVRRNANLLSWALLGLAVLSLVGALWYRHAAKEEGERQAEFNSLVLNRDSDMKPDDRLAKMKALLHRDGDKGRLAATTYEIGLEYANRALRASGEEKKTLADEAADYFSQAVTKYPKQSWIVAKARLALANLAMGRGDWAKAQEEIQAVQSMSALTGYPILEMAEEARRKLDQFKQPVVFATTAPAPATGPSSASAPASQGAAESPASNPVSGSAPIRTTRPGTSAPAK